MCSGWVNVLVAPTVSQYPTFMDPEPTKAGTRIVRTTDLSMTFAYTPLLPLGPDRTEYRLVTTDGVGRDGRFVTVDATALTRLTTEAMKEIAHFLRPKHLIQLRSII